MTRLMKSSVLGWIIAGVACTFVAGILIGHAQSAPQSQTGRDLYMGYFGMSSLNDDRQLPHIFVTGEGDLIHVWAVQQRIDATRMRRNEDYQNMEILTEIIYLGTSSPRYPLRINKLRFDGTGLTQNQRR